MFFDTPQQLPGEEAQILSTTHVRDISPQVKKPPLWYVRGPDPIHYPELPESSFVALVHCSNSPDGNVNIKLLYTVVTGIYPRFQVPPNSVSPLGYVLANILPPGIFRVRPKYGRSSSFPAKSQYGGGGRVLAGDFNSHSQLWDPRCR